MFDLLFVVSFFAQPFLSIAQVRSWLGAEACEELLRLIHFDLRFARDILRPPPIWFESASERLKKVLNCAIISTYFIILYSIFSISPN